jgi:hypothetical protein
MRAHQTATAAHPYGVDFVIEGLTPRASFAMKSGLRHKRRRGEAARMRV